MSGEAAAASRFFDAIAGRYERRYALGAPESRERMRRVLGALPEPPARVLDLGVGTGRELSALLDAGHSPTGVDVSAEMLARCGRRARPVALVQADFWEGLPLGDASFDACVALHGTLAHPPDDEALSRLSREIARVVRAGGVWVVEAPSPAWLEALATLPQPADALLQRTGAQTFVFTDRVAGVSISGRVHSEAQWRQALAPHWDARVEPLGGVEWFVAARRVAGA